MKRSSLAVQSVKSIELDSRSDLVLTKATIKAAELLGVKNVDLAKVIGISESQVSRICNGEKTIAYGSKTAELALIFIRIFRSLDALVGNNDQNRLKWMDSFNRGINGVPIHSIQNVEGLIKVVNYLDGMRAKV